MPLSLCSQRLTYTVLWTDVVIMGQLPKEAHCGGAGHLGAQMSQVWVFEGIVGLAPDTL